jgi:hypothetical protein
MASMSETNAIQYVPDKATGKKIHELVKGRKVFRSKAALLAASVELFVPALLNGSAVIENGRIVIRDAAKFQSVA